MRYILYMFAFCLLSIVAYAKNITFDEALSYGLINSIFVDKFEKERTEKFGFEFDDTKLENPEIEYEYNLKNNTNSLQLAQPFRLSDITLSRKSYKKLLDKLVANEEKLDLLKLYHQISLIYYDLYIIQEKHKYEQQRLSFLNKVYKQIHNSMNQDSLLSAEIYAFDADKLSIEENIKQLSAEVKKSKLDFLQTLNLSDTSLVLSEPPTIKLSMSFDQLLKSIQHTPNYRDMLALRHNQAKEMLKILKQDRYFPKIQPKIIYGQTDDNRKSEFGAGLTLSIPLWNKQDGQYSALKANEKYLQKEIETIDNISFEEMLKNAYDRLETQISIFQKYHNKIVPMYRQSVQKIEDSFINGQTTIIDVWQIREKSYETYEKYLFSLKNVLIAKIELETLIGSRLEDL